MSRSAVFAVGLAVVLAGTAAADVLLGSTTTTGRATGTGTGGTVSGTTTGGTATTAGPLADILALAEFFAEEFDLTFDDPMDEVYFFFAVADLYFQVMHQQQSGPATGGTGSTLGSLTTVAK